jgi:hypothetical protein
MASFISSRMVVIGEIYLEIYHHIPLSSGIIRTGVRTALLNGLGRNYMEKCENKSKKTAMDYLDYD